MKCNATSKRTHVQCGANAIPGKEKCKWHGGRSTGAPIKTGRYSKSLGAFRQAYQESLSDASLLDLREPIAVIDAMAKRAMERAVEGDTPGFRTRAKSLVAEAIKARAVENGQALDELLAKLEALMRDGVAEDRSAKVLVDTASKLARRIEGALHIKLARKSAMGVKDIAALLSVVVEILKRRVADPELRMVIVREIDQDVFRGVGAKAGRLTEGNGVG